MRYFNLRYGVDLKSQELTAYSDFLHMVLKIVNSIISHQLPHNVHLVYALMYQEDMFKPLQAHPRISGLVFNIEKVVETNDNTQFKGYRLFPNFLGKRKIRVLVY